MVVIMRLLPDGACRVKQPSSTFVGPLTDEGTSCGGRCYRVLYRLCESIRRMDTDHRFHGICLPHFIPLEGGRQETAEWAFWAVRALRPS
jgi:hypothetical protein